MTAMAQQRFDLATRTDADLFQTTGAAADDDLLLRRALYDDRAVDAREVFAHFFKLLCDHGGDVRDLVTSDVQDLLAHYLGHHHAQRLVRQLVFREDRLPLPA